MLGRARLIHPFPSALDALVTAAIALVAGADVTRAAALGAAMFALQASIGAVNDLADRDADALTKPHKPLVDGRVTVATARGIAIAGLAIGLGLSALLGMGVLAIALVGVGVGYLYDLRFKGTASAWLPFALGVPLLPLYAWVGAGAAIPDAFAVLVPAAVAAGAGLALGNQLDDLDDDTAAAVNSTARRLGRSGAWTVMAALHAGVATAALGSLLVFGGRGAGVTAVLAGSALLAVGVLAARWGRGPGRRAWELQASGLGVVAAGWVAALAEGGALTP